MAKCLYVLLCVFTGCCPFFMQSLFLLKRNTWLKFMDEVNENDEKINIKAKEKKKEKIRNDGEQWEQVKKKNRNWIDMSEQTKMLLLLSMLVNPSNVECFHRWLGKINDTQHHPKKGTNSLAHLVRRFIGDRQTRKSLLSLSLFNSAWHQGFFLLLSLHFFYTNLAIILKRNYFYLFTSLFSWNFLRDIHFVCIVW